MGGQLRPRHITQDAFAAKLREAGFPACSKAAVSLAERSKESGVEFTAEARKAAQELLNTGRARENRANPNKTTVWLDDELREWVETRAYMEDIPVGELIRQIIREAKESAASDAGTTKAAGGGLLQRADCPALFKSNPTEQSQERFAKEEYDMKTANEKLKVYAKEKGVFLWEIADRYGVNDGNFSRKLRRELPVEERERILRLIDEIAAEREVR